MIGVAHTAKVAATSKRANRGSKPGERRGGRQKGTPNKINGDLKAMILEALHNKGGVSYLVEQAAENPTAFMGLIGKVLPMTIAGDEKNPVVTKVVIEWGSTSASKE